VDGRKREGGRAEWGLYIHLNRGYERGSLNWIAVSHRGDGSISISIVRGQRMRYQHLDFLYVFWIRRPFQRSSEGRTDRHAMFLVSFTETSVLLRCIWKRTIDARYRKGKKMERNVGKYIYILIALVWRIGVEHTSCMFLIPRTWSIDLKDFERSATHHRWPFFCF
jgi:hypothetical protein